MDTSLPQRHDARILPGQHGARQFHPQRLFRGSHEGVLRLASDADGMNLQTRDERP
jgi:hypothetical protein